MRGPTGTRTRRLVLTTNGLLAKIVAAEATRAPGRPVAISTKPLRNLDLQGIGC